jgi:hypothetical protein
VARLGTANEFVVGDAGGHRPRGGGLLPDGR